MSHDYNIKGYLFAETEGFIYAIQDKVMRTRNYEKHILKLNVEEVCRKCKASSETIEHIIGGCSALADTIYLARHNQVAKIIYLELAKMCDLVKDSPPFFCYTPQPVLESNKYVLYWDRTMLTDKSCAHNRPDIVLIDKKEKIGALIDIAVPLTHNITKTEIEKINKYQNLKEDLQKTWKLKTACIIPIVISGEGVVSKDFKKYLETLQIKTTIFKIIQKSVILETYHLVRRFLHK